MSDVSAQPSGQCSNCGAPIDPSIATYSEEGALICKRCEANQTIDQGDKRASASIFGGGVGALGAGLASFCCNPFYIGSILAIVGGIGAISMALRHPEYKARMGWQYGATIAFGLIGVVLGIASLLLSVLGAAVGLMGR